jgi:hypothetical protein
MLVDLYYNGYMLSGDVPRTRSVFDDVERRWDVQAPLSRAGDYSHAAHTAQCSSRYTPRGAPSSPERGGQHPPPAAANARRLTPSTFSSHTLSSHLKVHGTPTPCPHPAPLPSKEQRRKEEEEEEEELEMQLRIQPPAAPAAASPGLAVAAAALAPERLRNVLFSLAICGTMAYLGIQRRAPSREHLPDALDGPTAYWAARRPSLQ